MNPDELENDFMGPSPLGPNSMNMSHVSELTSGTVYSSLDSYKIAPSAKNEERLSGDLNSMKTENYTNDMLSATSNELDNRGINPLERLYKSKNKLHNKAEELKN